MPEPPASSSPSPAPPAPRWLRLLLLPVVLLLAGGWALVSIRPPAPRPADAPPEVFSAARAMEHLSWLAAEPHPLGSKAHRRVRERLVAELEALGLGVELQRAEMIESGDRRPGVSVMATVTNVLARLPGTRGHGKALALMAHYDSVPRAPGAADDGSGVITLLETLRALQHLPPLANDLLVVITDGEERGLLGARAFTRHRRRVDEIGLVLNFEARGSRGPVFMFETSEGNAPLIAALAEAAPYPFANSLTYAVYRRLPNDTDLTVTKAAGLPGLNFAFNDGFYDYHTEGDRPEHLSPASVQHAGSYALALTRHFGDADLGSLVSPSAESEGAGSEAGDVTYFDTVGFHLVRYPMARVPWLTGLTLALLAAVVTLALIRAKRAAGRGAGALARGLVAFTLQVALSLTAVGIGSALLTRVSAEPGVAFRALLARQGALLAAELLILAGVSVLVWGAFARGLPLPGVRKPAAALPLSLGALVGWGLLLLLVTVEVPAAAFLFTWPLLAAVVGHGVALCLPPAAGATPADARCEPKGRLLALTAGALPGILWLVPYSLLFFVALGVAQPVPALAPAALLIGLLVPGVLALEATSRRMASGACLAAGVALLVSLSVGSPFDARHPKPVELFVWHDVDRGEVRWASPEETPDRWTRSVLGEAPARHELAEVLPGSPGVLWTAPAAAGSLWLPRLEGIEGAPANASGTHRFRLRVPRGAESVALSIPQTARITAARLDGEPVEIPRPDGPWWTWWYHGLPPEGVEIELDTARPGPIELHLTALTHDLPQPLAHVLAERPADRMARPRSLADCTVVTRTMVVSDGVVIDRAPSPGVPGETPGRARDGAPAPSDVSSGSTASAGG